MAELIACMAKNRDLSYCKVVEVIAETTAPLTPMEKLLEKIPSQRAGTFPPKVSSFFSCIERIKSTLPGLFTYLKNLI